MPVPAAERHPHLGEPLAPGRVRVDLHLHTMWSGDATTTPDELAEAVAGTGLDAICVTDHHSVAGAFALTASPERSASWGWSAQLGCRVVVGEELRTAAGELIGLFLTERLPFGLAPREAAERIRAQGGLVYVPHPFDPTRHALREDALSGLVADGLVDAIETFNAKTPLASLNRRAADFAAEHGLPAGAGSDAHEPSALGAAYVEVPDFDGPAPFLAALGEGTVGGPPSAAPRPWRPRIVPSTSAFAARRRSGS